MVIQKNMAIVMRALKESSGKSLSEFSADLEISRSALQNYLSGKGNPNAATIDHLAGKLGIDASFLVSGTFSHNQIEILLKVLELMNFLSGLTPTQRLRFAELLGEMILLLNGDSGDV